MSDTTREEDEYIWVKRVPVIDEAMIERAADELRIIDDEWDAMSPMTNRGMASGCCGLRWR